MRANNLVRSDLPSFEILDKLINYFSYSSFKDKESLNKVFSKYYEEKSKAFEYNVTIDIREILCIIKYDSEKTYQSGELSEICDYYIVRKKSNNYYILGLIKNKNNSFYEPVTSRTYSNEDAFTEFMNKIARKQEITYAYGLKIDNSSNDYHTNIRFAISDKQAALAKLQLVANKYDSVISVAKDFSFTLSNTQNQLQANNNIIALIRALSEAIRKGNILTEDNINELLGDNEIQNDAIRELINICNDNLFRQNASSCEQVEKSYSSIKIKKL